MEPFGTIDLLHFAQIKGIAFALQKVSERQTFDKLRYPGATFRATKGLHLQSEFQILPHRHSSAGALKRAPPLARRRRSAGTSGPTETERRSCLIQPLRVVAGSPIRPPTSPVYHVTYVKVEKSSEDEVVCSYTAGYSGAYVAGVATGAALVWGTGYCYSPYIYPGPIYRPYYATYGLAAAYYPYSGVYAVGGYAYGPYASAGRAAWYNPATGGYGRAYTSQNPYGGRTYAYGYNPSTDTAWTTQQGHGYYGQWGTSTVTRGGETYQAGHVVTDYGSTAVAKGPNNLYAGHDGNAYKRDNNGDWSKWDNGQWQPVNPQAGSNVSSQNQPAKRADKKSTQTNRQPGNEPAGTKRTAGGAAGQGSNDVTSGLDREASARQRGSQNVNLQQKSQQRATQGNRTGRQRQSSSASGRSRQRN
jgi:hypothetical protein